MAFSSGSTICDAIHICESGTCPDGMELVGKPERSEVYRVETDSASYTPGGLVELRIRVMQPMVAAKRNAGKSQCSCTGRRCPELSSAGGCDCDLQQRRCTVGDPILEPSKYLGLLLYSVKANDPTEAKVGSWEMPAEVDGAPRFAPMLGPGCDGKALVQTSARTKRYTERFWYRAPPAGTGPITFRVLLKQGETLGGSFYWPSTGNGTGTAPPSNGVAGGDLELPEAAAPPTPPVVWLRGDAGASCSAVCGASGRTCDAASFSAAVTSAGLLSQVGGSFLCRRPMLSACEAYAPSTSSYGDGWCWFNDPAACSSAAAPTCDSAAPPTDVGLTGLRFCPCAAGAAGRRLEVRAPGEEGQAKLGMDLPPDHLPVQVTADAAVGTARKNASPCPFATAINSSSQNQPHSQPASYTGYSPPSPSFHRHLLAAVPSATLPAALLATLPLIGLVGVALVAMRRRHRDRPGARAGPGVPPSRALLMTTQLLVSIDPTAAHNWINSPRSRASKASEVSPCLPRTSSVPHVRINPGQEFLVEWASGHPGSQHYFVMLRAEDEDKMSLHSEAVLDAYLNAAPAGSDYLPVLTSLLYRKMHYGWAFVGGRQQSRAGGDETSHTKFTDQGLVEINEASTEFTPRPAAFSCANYGSKAGSWDKGNCEPVADLRLYRYKDADHASDKRAAYVNPAYPHILAVHRFKAIKPTKDKAGFPKQFDTARFKFPDTATIGPHIIQYFWRGYRDCVSTPL